ncbi:zinc finger and SCAN domain-containing protein 5A-like [Sitodiplosis mosellana]|uniref:zinc finger and SCAN domain-containing protein 5A-like n=1 Tax=Sitodiplosis mosellana TaxID=263140 RepID=UPI002444A515|nr:zinc finger and SCAN domain-containing protein 5A-like [Sitodiplosis mosellana]
MSLTDNFELSSEFAHKSATHRDQVTSLTTQRKSPTHAKKMNPFKGGSGGCKRLKPKSAKVEVKAELVIKEEPNRDDVMSKPRPRVDGRYRANYNGPFDFDYDFDVVKDEIKCEEEETGTEKDSAPRERSNDSAAANDDDNEEPMGDAFDVQPPQPIGSGNKRNGISKRRDKRTIPRNQATKKQTKHKCPVCNHFTDRNDQFPFQCSKCFGGFATEDGKEVHEDRCGHRQYQCHLCKEHRRDKQYLKIHMRNDHTGERIQCKVCAAGFVIEGSADRHMKTVDTLQKLYFKNLNSYPNNI